VLARMWQAGDVGACLTNGPKADGKDEYKKALEGVKCRVLVMPSRTDQYFGPEDSEVEVKHLKRGRLEVIETIWGHIAGGGANPVNTEFIDAKIKEFLSEEEAVGVKL
jgi:homoserine acetyltransferase